MSGAITNGFLVGLLVGSALAFVVVGELWVERLARKAGLR